MKKVLVLLYLFLPIVSANIVLNFPVNATNCLTYEDSIFSYTPSVQNILSCSLYTNNSGSWRLEKTNISVVDGSINYFTTELIPNPTLWAIQCSNASISVWSSNYSFVEVDAPYCAVLSETSCQSEANIGSDQVIITRLTNTLGYSLENQDCSVWVENWLGEPIIKYNTMLVNQLSSIQLDKDGNWINVGNPDAILTDSNGYYVYSFLVDPKWAYFGDNYTVKVGCNGQITSCDFVAIQNKLPDIPRYEYLGKAAFGLLVLIILIVMMLLYLWRSIRRR